MSLDSILQQTKSSLQTERSIPLFLPPEYSIEMDQWRELFQVFNRMGRPTKVAEMIRQFILEKNPGKSLEGIISISDVFEEDGQFYTDLSFTKDRPGLTALVIFKAERLRLVPISSPRGDGGIQHVVMTYIPD